MNNRSASNSGASSNNRGVANHDTPEKQAWRRRLYEFMIQLGIRLEARDRTTCTAILIINDLFKRSQLVDKVCVYTLSLAAMRVSGKMLDDKACRTRDIANVSFRLLHTDDPPLEMDDERIWKLRDSIGNLEFILLREIRFDITYDHPHTHLSYFIDTLRNWYVNEFYEVPVADRAFAYLRDAYVNPEFVMRHSVESLAVTVLTLALVDTEGRLDHVDMRHIQKTFYPYMLERKLKFVLER